MTELCTQEAFEMDEYAPGRSIDGNLVAGVQT